MGPEGPKALPQNIFQRETTACFVTLVWGEYRTVPSGPLHIHIDQIGLNGL